MKFDTLERRRAYWGFWSELLELEWGEEERAMRQRLAQWPLERLEREGYCLNQLRGTARGSFFGKALVRLQLPSNGRTQTSEGKQARHGFGSGDEVLLSHSLPPESGGMRAEVTAVGDNFIELAMAELPAELTERRWRLDRGSNRTAHVRIAEGLANFVSDRYSGPPALRSAILSAAVTDGSLASQTTYSAISRGMISDAISAAEIAARATPSDSREAEAGVGDAVPALNPSQRQAVEAACERPVSLIQGPPGTGDPLDLRQIPYKPLQIPADRL